jgi:hypothetical protein
MYTYSFFIPQELEEDWKAGGSGRGWLTAKELDRDTGRE